MIVRLDLKGEGNGLTIIQPVSEDEDVMDAVEEAIQAATANLFTNLALDSVREHLGLE